MKSSIQHQRPISAHPCRANETKASHGNLIPVTAWPDHHTWPPIGGLRHLIFFEKTNGFDKVIRRIGRRVLIDEQAFFAWVDQQGGAK